MARLTSIICPLIAVVLYPRSRWLFAVALVGVVILMLLTRFSRVPSPIAVADHAQRLLDGTGGTWDVDDYEHLNPREPAFGQISQGADDVLQLVLPALVECRPLFW
jgi:hypothetical protein